MLALVSCSDPKVTSPPAREPEPVAPPASQPVLPTPDFPAVTKPAEIFLSLEEPSEATYNLTSRYVLYHDDTFALQFVGPGKSLEYPGRYWRAGSVIIFSWDDSNPRGGWSASGTLNGDALVVQYNVMMLLSDFVDGTYIRQSGP